jgi:DNA invertase Pin-like site-specific DNA recombinase
MKGQLVGYVRVSTSEQNTDRQLEGIQLDEVFTDKASGKDVNRPELEAMLKHVRKGDVVIVHSMDRLARNLDDLRRIVKGLTDRGVRVEFVKEALAFTGDDSAMATLLLSMLGIRAQPYQGKTEGRYRFSQGEGCLQRKETHSINRAGCRFKRARQTRSAKG